MSNKLQYEDSVAVPRSNGGTWKITQSDSYRGIISQGKVVFPKDFDILNLLYSYLSISFFPSTIIIIIIITEAWPQVNALQRH